METCFLTDHRILFYEVGPVICYLSCPGCDRGEYFGSPNVRVHCFDFVNTDMERDAV